MRVRDLIERKANEEVVTVEPSADVATAARLLMEQRIGGLPVVTHEGELVGMVAEREIVRAVHMHASSVRNLSVLEVMRRPAPTCRLDDDLVEVAARMNRERLRHLVVLDGGGRRIAGMLSIGDIVRRRVEELELETGVLRDYVVAQRARD